jgi:imidazolonepropionase-like amidohydrolase
MRIPVVRLLALCLSLSLPATAQVTFPVNGTTDPRHTLFAFTHARIYVDYHTVLDSAVLLVRDGRIVDVGRGVAVPADAVVYDLSGRTIYPSLIDIFSDYGQPPVNKPAPGDGFPQFLSNTKGAYSWNQAVKSEYAAAAHFAAVAAAADEWRKLGFGMVSSFSRDGIARGTSALVLLGDEAENDLVVKEQAAVNYSFDKGSSTQDYPSSLMGAIALLRQTWYDARWYASLPEGHEPGQGKEVNLTLEALNRTAGLPQVFEAGDKLNVLRVAALGKEFGMSFIVRTSGNDYQRLQDIRATGQPLILPLNFPEAVDVTDPEEALNIPLTRMKHWELAPANPGLVAGAGIPFALTASDLKKKDDFWKNLRKAVAYGLSKEDALKALTVTPAGLLGVGDRAGSLRKGYMADFIITSQDLFHKDNVILENWVAGRRYLLREYTSPDIRGTYVLSVPGTAEWSMTVSGDVVNPDIQMREDTFKFKASYVRQAQRIHLFFETPKTRQSYRFSGDVSDASLWEGQVTLPDGNEASWSARRVSAEGPRAAADTSRRDTLALGSVWYPFSPYGWTEKPSVRAVLFRNATVWTNEKDGIRQHTDVLIRDGKIRGIGRNLDSAGAEVIDATGMHLTSGIIDEHSHIAVTGAVNEATQASSAEVRIGDVIDCDDIDIYRQLAGGVTTSHILHGSANPIGGQTQLIKLRWGDGPEALKFAGWPGFIKFALGENVKQSNWGDRQATRFPQTRMGVEQVYTDYFTRAREYAAAGKKYASLTAKEKSLTVAPRRNLELDALEEILEGKRFITCHSYEQSEINMLMHVADTFGFRVNTFTHILEGYKVADKMKRHGAGASTFSDWWAYKYEVYEAIPYNGALMHGVGLTVAYNSDDPEQARRLNQEAAKAVKYGGVSEEEAWKFVTLNPAKLLHIDGQTGSIAVGKDADVVLWDRDPLSVYARPLQTYVDGIRYYDVPSDSLLRVRIRAERARLVRQMLEAKKRGENVQPPVVKLSTVKHCVEEEHYFLNRED